MAFVNVKELKLWEAMLWNDTKTRRDDKQDRSCGRTLSERGRPFASSCLLPLPNIVFVHAHHGLCVNSIYSIMWTWYQTTWTINHGVGMASWKTHKKGECVPWLLFCIARTEVFTALAESPHIAESPMPHEPSTMGLEWPHERHIKMSIEYVPWLLFCIARTEILTAFAERVHISHGSAPNAPSGR